MIIIGIDPGTATTGYGVVKRKKYNNKKSFECLGFGCIKTKSDTPTPERLKLINNQLGKIIKKHRPNILAVESLYFFKNLKTAMPVSQAKGVILLTAAKKKIPVYEVTPLEVKMTIAGYGRATKKQIKKMIKTMLKIENKIKPIDAADALGVAVCGALKKENNLGEQGSNQNQV